MIDTALKLDFHDIIRDPLPKDFQQRRGKFTARESLITEQPRHLLTIMSHCIIVRAEMLWHVDEIEYTALSPYFRPIRRGEITPLYHWIIEVNKDSEIIRLKAVEVK